ncbi:hypothetical protein LTI14_10610 [Nesterenkonia sp. YGD6]|uniref:hypothetical protein n=1 Tax=Nesterenkonia sp. YGD6 TaxID=2901231 RepID=UPI001F4CEC65|nr:hypothetical protein [Nesterenkonia sp. YGD6]MCH8563661.1 hypothetical protein [Nesterenkonia sp. YGD6]
MDWENWLRTAGKPPSDSEEARTRSTRLQIERALDNHEPLRGRAYRVYVKGSHANNTNVRLNYDVDVAVEYHGYFYSEMSFELEGKDHSLVGVVDSSDQYTRTQFKNDIWEALTGEFGESAVTAGKIAYRVREKQTTLPADVVPCWEYRRYDGFQNGQPIEHVGSRVYPSSGGWKTNFPRIQQQKGVAKNIATGRRYKFAVRALKKLQTQLVVEGKLDSELSSYFTESLVFNVSDDAFGHSAYLADMREVLRQIFNETLPSETASSWTHVHGLMYLFHDGFTRRDAHRMADVAWKHMGFE